MYRGRHLKAAREKRPPGGVGSDEQPGPLEFIIFYDLTDKIDSDDWEEY